MTSTSDTNQIERSILINASRDRVWRALSNAEEFGAWFGADLTGQAFKAGQRVRAPMKGCGHEDVYFDAVIERLEPQELMSFHWHPYSVEPKVDYSAEQPTLVTFTIKDVPDNGVLLTVVESGFDQIPAHRRREAFEMHGKGWDAQIQNVVRHVSN